MQGGEERDVLLSHVADLCRRAQGGTFCHTAFLTPGQWRDVQELLCRTGHRHRAVAWGGYREAERCCVLLFPDYCIELLSPTEQTTPEALLALCGEEDPVCALHIRGSGFSRLAHRDYLGSLLAQGLEREVLGDVVVTGDCEAYVFCRRAMAEYLCRLERVGGDGVRVERVLLPPDFAPQRRVQPISDTVASARLDCVVAALGNCSRDAAQSLVRDGRVELDFRVELRVDHVVTPPAVLTVRGVGKFRVLSVATQTKKGRYRLSAEKYL